MTLYRAHGPRHPADDPFTGGHAARRRRTPGCSSRTASSSSAARIRGSSPARHPDEESSTCAAGWCCPASSTPTCTSRRSGPSAGSGMPLLDWLERCALPEEARLADAAYAAAVAGEFVAGLVDAGTTTALVFGSHFAARRGRRCSPRPTRRRAAGHQPGWCVSDRILRDDLLTTPDRAYAEGRALAERWHGEGRTRYAVTPRFSLSCHATTMLDVVRGAAWRRAPESGSPRTSTRTRPRSPRVPSCSAARTTSTPTTGTAWSGRAACSPTTCTPPTRELRAARPRRTRAWRTARPATPPWAAACSRCGATSTPASGWRSGSDVGAGTGFSLFKEGLQAYFMQQLLGARRPAADRRAPALPGHRGRRATRSGSTTQVGDSRRRQAVRRGLAAAARRPTLDVALRHAADRGRRAGQGRSRWPTRPTSPAVWVDGTPVKNPHIGVS